MVENCSELGIPFPGELAAEGLIVGIEDACGLGVLAYQLDFNLQVCKYLMTDLEEDLFEAVSKRLREIGLVVSSDSLKYMHLRCGEIEDDFGRLVYFCHWCYGNNIILTEGWSDED